MLYIIYAESAQYAGYGQHFIVKANSIAQAEELVEDSANEYFYELYMDELEEDGLTEEGTFYSICSVEEFTEQHECWKYYKDPSQSVFYTEANF